MGGLLLKKMAEIRHFFVHFCVRRVFWCFFCRGVCGVWGCVGVLLWLVVSFFCVMWWGRADFRGIGCRCVRDDGAVGCSVVIVLWV